MCDIYRAPCEASYCHEIVELHITDDERPETPVPRHAIRARCHAHSPTEPGWSMWETSDDPQGRGRRLAVYVRIDDGGPFGLWGPIDNWVHPNAEWHSQEARYIPRTGRQRRGGRR